MLSMGKILAYSGMMQDKEVSWFPSYGPEMRGGTANVTVILSDERISSPILNQQSMDKFEHTVKKGGVLIYDPNGIVRHPERTDIDIYTIDAADEAAKLGLAKVFNMFVLGAFLKIKPLISSEYIHKGLEKSLPARRHNMIPENEKAIARGQDLVKAVHMAN